MRNYLRKYEANAAQNQNAGKRSYSGEGGSKGAGTPAPNKSRDSKHSFDMRNMSIIEELRNETQRTLTTLEDNNNDGMQIELDNDNIFGEDEGNGTNA